MSLALGLAQQGQEPQEEDARSKTAKGKTGTLTAFKD